MSTSSEVAGAEEHFKRQLWKPTFRWAPNKSLRCLLIRSYAPFPPAGRLLLSAPSASGKSHYVSRLLAQQEQLWGANYFETI